MIKGQTRVKDKKFACILFPYAILLFPMDEQAMGANIRLLRQQAKLTIDQAARQAELTKGTLSKIETGNLSSSISTLMRIADSLGVPLAEFFIEPQKAPSFVLTRQGEGKTITRDGSRFGYSYEALAPDMPRKQVEPFILTIRPGDPVGKFRHGGQELIYMLEGKLRFTIDDEKLTLQPGDSLYFDPTCQHTTEVIGKKAAKFLCVFIQRSADEPPIKMSHTKLRRKKKL